MKSKNDPVYFTVPEMTQNNAYNSDAFRYIYVPDSDLIVIHTLTECFALDIEK